MHAAEFKIAQTKAQRGGHLSYARFACVCVHIADTVWNDYPILSDTKTNKEETIGNGAAHVCNLRGKCKKGGKGEGEKRESRPLRSFFTPFPSLFDACHAGLKCLGSKPKFKRKKSGLFLKPFWYIKHAFWRCIRLLFDVKTCENHEWRKTINTKKPERSQHNRAKENNG